MKAPDKIYLQTCGDCPGLECESCQFQDLVEVSWCEDKIFDTDKEYIRKDIVDETIQTAEDHAYFAGKEKLREELLEWAEAKKSELLNGEPTDVAVGINAGMDMIIQKLKSL